jgi:hypothetical protein
MKDLIPDILEYIGPPEVLFPDRSVTTRRISYEEFRIFVIGNLIREHHIYHRFHTLSKFDPNHNEIPLWYVEKIVEEATAKGWHVTLDLRCNLLKIYRNP